MTRALVAAALLAAACKGKGTDNDKAREAPPVTASGDAAPPAPVDAPAAARCIPVVPFGDEAAAAGIRPLTHHPHHSDAANKPPRELTVLPIGVPTSVKLVPGDGHDPVNVALLEFYDIDPWVEAVGKKSLRFTAPAELEGAVLQATTEDDTALLGFGAGSVETYARFEDKIAASRRDSPLDPRGDGKTAVDPIAVVYDDIDANGTSDLVALYYVSEDKPASDHGGGAMMVRAPDAELAVQFDDNHGAGVRLGQINGVLALFVVPPALSGGSPLVFGRDGTRIEIDDGAMKLLSGSDEYAGHSPAGDLNRILDKTLPDAAPPPLTVFAAHHVCLETSATAAATLRPID